jgi:hypothetical protein
MGYQKTRLFILIFFPINRLPQATYSYLAYEDVSVLIVPYCARIFDMMSPETAEERLVGGGGGGWGKRTGGV